MKSFHILKYRYIYFGIMGFLFVISTLSLIFSQLNFGIDMTGGSQIEFSYKENSELSLEDIKKIAEDTKNEINTSQNIISLTQVYKINGENQFVVETGFLSHASEQDVAKFKILHKDALANAYKSFSDISLVKYTNIGASFGKYIQNTAILTLVLAIAGIGAYLAYAFSSTVGGISSLSFGLITIVTLFHDVVIASGFYAFTSHFFPQFQIDTFFVTALLTILGYSINDTIVVFDRIRSNLRKYAGKGKDLGTIIEDSINETFVRSIYTSLALVFTLVSILLFGPDTIQGFTLTMLYGTIVGTFSSICIAAPLLYEFHKNTLLTVYQAPREWSEDDKMVV